MNISFYTLGCKLNYAETSQLQAQFEREGHSVVEFGQPADAVIVNTCTVTENADRECRQVIRRALRHSPEAFVAVTGCYAQLQPEEIASIDGVDAVFGAKEKFAITQYVQEFAKSATPKIFVSELQDDLEFVEAQSGENDSRTRAFLKIQDGCNYNCSFCTIPLARGGSRAMPFSRIAEKLHELEQAGYHEVVLSGINLGDYKAPTGEKFPDVVQFIDVLQPRLRARISSIEPNLLTPEILDIVTNSRVFVPHFHIPLQSGSPAILRLMRRRYNAPTYNALVHSIKQAMPHCAIGVDVIVGFPGETDELFEETFAFLHDAPVTYLHVFNYSERDNTPAASYAGKVPSHVKKERISRLRTLSALKKNEFYRSQCGTERVVIPEQRDPTTGRWVGWTDNYVRVEFAADSTLLQMPVRVRLLELHGEHVLGELAEHQLDTRPVVPPSYIPILN